MLGAIYNKIRQTCSCRHFYRIRCEGQAWVDYRKHSLPNSFCLFIFLTTLDYVAQSWSMREASADPGGIPAVYLLKSLLPMMAIGLILQGLAETLRSVLVILDEDAHK